MNIAINIRHFATGVKAHFEKILRNNGYHQCYPSDSEGRYLCIDREQMRFHTFRNPISNTVNHITREKQTVDDYGDRVLVYPPMNSSDTEILLRQYIAFHESTL